MLHFSSSLFTTQLTAELAIAAARLKLPLSFRFCDRTFLSLEENGELKRVITLSPNITIFSCKLYS